MSLKHSLKIGNWKLKIILSFFILYSSFLILPTSSSAATIAKPPNNLGLVGYWSFNEGTSTKAGDFSGNNNNGTLSGTLPTWVSGKFGKALSINAVNNSYVTSADNMPITGDAAFTISGWFYFRSATAAGVLGWGNTSVAGQATGFYWGIQGTRILSVEYAGGTSAYVNSTLQLNRWYHIVYTKSAGAINTTSTFYVDGANFGSVTGSASTPNISAGKMLVGAWARSDQGGADVIIDDVRIYNRALSAAEVRGLYGSGGVKLAQGASNNSLLGYWKLDEGASTVALDSSGNGRRGTLQSSPTWVAGKLGRALNFNGSTQYVSIGDIDVGTRYSVGAWIYPTAWPVSGDAYIHNIFCDEAAGNNTTFCFRIGSQGLLSLRQRCALAAYVTTGANDLESTTDLQLNRWTHCMVTADNSGATKTVKFYINGVLDRTQTYTGTVVNGTAGFQIASSPDANRFFEGRLDDIRFYNRLLTDAEVAAAYQANAQKVNASAVDLQKGSSLESGLVGHWTFDGADVTSVVADKSGQGNNAYIYNVATSSALTIGKLGQGIQLDGTNDFVRTTGNIGITGDAAFTIAGWFYFKSSSNEGVLGWGNISAGLGAAGFYWGFRGTDVLSAEYAGSNGVYVNSAIPLNGWHHIAYVKTPGAINTTSTFYVDGANQGSVLGSAGTPNIQDTALSIGCWGGPANCSGAIEAKVDDFRIYNRALSASEVLQLYRLGK